MSFLFHRTGLVNGVRGHSDNEAAVRASACGDARGLGEGTARGPHDRVT